MAVNFRQVGFKLFNQLKNGEDFSQNLTEFKDNLAGYVGGKYKAVIDFIFSVSWSKNNDTPLKVNVTSDWFSFEGVDWQNEGFNVGDRITGRVVLNGVNKSFACNITSIVGDRVYFDNFGSVSGVTDGEYVGVKAIYLQERPNSINYSFGFVENSDEYSNNSLLTGASQTYYGTAVTPLVDVDLLPKGQVEDWVTGSCTFSDQGGDVLYEIYDGATYQVGLNFAYQVNHEFILNPFFREGDVSRLTNENGVVQPPYLSGDFSLKYVYEPELRRELSNPNTAVSYQEDSLLGSVAYFNENFNGFNNNYNVVSFDYEDNDTNEVLSGINPSLDTLINFRIAKNSSITANHKISFSVFKCSSEAEYTGTTSTDLEENFLFDNLTCEVGGAFNTGTGIIQEVRATAQITTEFTGYAILSYDNTEQLKIKEGDFFVISVAVTDNSQPAGSEDTVNLLLDVNQYDTSIDISGLATMPTFEIYDPKADAGFSSIEAFNEDNVHAKCQLRLDLTKQAFLNSLSTKLVAYNPTTFNYFELDNFNVDYSEVISNGEQQLTYNGGKNYPDSITDSQNDVTLTNGIELGNELVTNGDFSNGSTGWSFVNTTLDLGGARINNTDVGGANAYIFQSNSLVNGKTYLLEYDILETNGGLLIIQNVDTDNLCEILNSQTIGIGKKLIFTFNRSVSTSITIKRRSGELLNIVIDNISVKEVIQSPDFTNLDLTFGQKINWKDWVFNRNADTIFYNSAKPNNNLNYKSSNYSELNGYEIRLAVLANIYGVDDLGRSGNTDYLFLSQKITTFDYDSNAEISGTIELFDNETNTSLGTSPRTDKDTLFKATWTDQLLTEAWGVNRIERADNVGFAIYELSSLTDYEGGILKPISGENRLKIEQVGNNIEATCLIDYTKLEAGVNYNLSARINLGAIVDPNSKLKTDGAIKLKTDAVIKIKAI